MGDRQKPALIPGGAGPMTDVVKVLFIKGIEGACLVVNDNRVAGPKPWGGGQTIHDFEVDKAELLRALGVVPSTTLTGALHR